MREENRWKKWVQCRLWHLFQDMHWDNKYTEVHFSIDSAVDVFLKKKGSRPM
jgi:hypothetical protein